MYPDYLIHYGVKGMKWGVRKKYYTKGGSYTAKGLKKFQDSAERYRTAKSNYKTEKNSSNRQKLKEAKSNLKFNKKQLKKDYLGDQGKELYARGVRISNNKKMHLTIQSAIGIGTSVAAYYLKSTGQNSFKNMMTLGAVSTGAAYVDGMFAVRDSVRNKKLSAFYSHSGKYK